MPLGVPKVPFQIPGEEDATWVDLYNRLYRQRALFLCDEIDFELANQIMGLMAFLTIEDHTLDQHLFINSPGGGIVPGGGIFDLMQVVPPTIHTICLGVSASMASLILSGGTLTHRLAFPHARVMIHQPASSFFESQTGEFVVEMDVVLALRQHIEDLYVQKTRQPHWVISRDIERDEFMSATDAIDYGLVDLLAEEGAGFVFGTRSPNNKKIGYGLLDFMFGKDKFREDKFREEEFGEDKFREEEFGEEEFGEEEFGEDKFREEEFGEEEFGEDKFREEEFGEEE